MIDNYSISFVLPMFNESENIGATIAALTALAGELAFKDYEIVVVDDASTDNAVDIVERISAEDPRVKSFRLSENTKFGGAFSEGFRRATKDVIVYMDSDLPVSIEDIKASLPLIVEADIVTGYSSVKKGDTLKRKVISGIYNLMVQTLFGLHIKDINSGYKVVKRDIVKDAEFISRSPFVDVELFLHAKRKDARVRQYPLVFLQRTGGKSYIAGLPIIWATFTDMIKVRIISCRKKA
ncbi:MAG: glycosyltransferase family 2 protein [Candidatus Tantalella remota]|nr:glycosyltransferase family 2 protein [Candidatus Tantalella remota]